MPQLGHWLLLCSVGTRLCHDLAREGGGQTRDAPRAECSELTRLCSGDGLDVRHRHAVRIADQLTSWPSQALTRPFADCLPPCQSQCAHAVLRVPQRVAKGIDLALITMQWSRSSCIKARAMHMMATDAAIIGFLSDQMTVASICSADEHSSAALDAVGGPAWVNSAACAWAWDLPPTKCIRWRMLTATRSLSSRRRGVQTLLTWWRLLRTSLQPVRRPRRQAYRCSMSWTGAAARRPLCRLLVRTVLGRRALCGCCGKCRSSAGGLAVCSHALQEPVSLAKLLVSKV